MAVANIATHFTIHTNPVRFANRTDEVASGLYFYTLTAGAFTATRQLLIQTISK